MDLTLIGFDMVHYLEFKGIRSTNSAVVAESMFQIKNHKYQWKASLAQKPTTPQRLESLQITIVSSQS